MLSRRYNYQIHSRSLLPLTTARRFAIAQLAEKRAAGVYREENVPCPCGGQEDEMLASRERWGIPMQTVICRRCGLIRTNPRLTDESWAQFYTHEYPHIHAHTAFSFSQDRSRYYPFLQQREYHRAHHIGQFITAALGSLPAPPGQQPALADIGTGTGGMMQYFAEKGYRVHGCDYDQHAVNHAVSTGWDVSLGGPASLRGKEPADLALLSHVLEHVTDALTYLDAVAALLRPGGYLYIELPGVRQISSRRYRNDFLRYLRFFHTFSFCLDSLTNLVESRGFTRVAGTEWIKALFRYEGTLPKPMSAQPHTYQIVRAHLNRAEVLRPLTTPYAVVVENIRHRRSQLAKPIIALGLKEPTKRLLRRLGYHDLE